jgi:hypothetical protein
MSSCHRQRASRARKRHGGAALMVEVDNVGALADVLVELGLLEQWDCEDRKAVEAALTRVIASWLNPRVTRDAFPKSNLLDDSRR